MAGRPAKPDPTRWAIYCRVSTSGQEENQSLAVQEQKCADWLTQRDLQCVDVYRDVCSGVLVDRPKLADLLEACRVDRIGGVIILRLDRLAREAIAQETILRQFTKMGVLVRSTQESENGILDDPEADPDPSRAFMRVVLAAAAELERALILQRTLAAKRRIKAAGGHHAGKIPYGMWVNPVNRKLEYRPEFIAWLCDGLWMRANNVSYDSIGEFWLQGGWRPNVEATRWHASVVKRLLDRAEKTGIQPSSNPSVTATYYVRGVRR